jgi:hypothetical protein
MAVGKRSGRVLGRRVFSQCKPRWFTTKAFAALEIEGQEELRRSAIRIQKRLLSLLGWFSNIYEKSFRCRESEGNKVGRCQP